MGWLLAHSWEDAKGGDDGVEDKVDRNEELAERARLARAEAVHESRERMVIAYIPAVESTRIHFQRLDSEFSQFSRHVSVHERAKSTRTRPVRINMVAPRQIMKKPGYGGWRHPFRR